MPIKISVIIPTFCREKWLENTILSVLKQQYNNMEIIITDNASTDNTHEMMKKFSRFENTKYFRNANNIGAVANMNQALLRYASGDFVLVLSDDDKLTDPYYLSKVAMIIEKYQDVVLVFANYNEVDLETQIVTNLIRFPTKQGIYDGRYFWYNYCNNNLFCPLITTVFSRKLAVELGGFSVDIPSVDMMLFLQLLLYGKCAFISDVVAEYGIHSNNAFSQIYREKNVKILVDDLDFIRIPAIRAIEIGIDKGEVESWKERMTFIRIREHLLKSIIPILRTNPEKAFDYYRSIKQIGEVDSFVSAILSIVRAS